MAIIKDQILLSDIRRKFLFQKRRSQGHFWSYIKNRIQWNWYPPLKIVTDFPLHVDIEISTHCNMNCAMCTRTTAGFKEHVKPKFMEERIFKKVIDECAKHKLFSVRLSLRGEPFIHPHIFEFIELTKKAGIKEVSLLTNGLSLTPEKFERLVQLKFDWLTISIDGLGHTYEAIRKPAKFNEAIDKVKTYHRIKKNYKSVKPVIKIQTIWPAIKDNPQEFYRTFLPYVDLIASNPLMDCLKLDKNIQYYENYDCPALYQRLVVGADGRMILCVYDDYGSYILGDVRNESIYEIWHGRRLNEARGWFRKRNRKWWEDAPCKYCAYPRKREKIENILIDGHNVTVEKYVNRQDEIPLQSE